MVDLLASGATDRSTRNWNSTQESYWSSLAPSYNSLYTNDWARRENELVATRLTFLANLDRPLVVDLAAGTGLGRELVLRANPQARYLGVDLAKAMLDAADDRFSAIVAAMDQIPIQSATADAVVCLFTSCSFASDLEGLFDEVERVLRPGGTGYLSVLSNSALSRVFRSNRYGHYQTRGDRDHGSVPVHRIRLSDANAALGRSRLILERREPLNALSGFCERPSLWSVGEMLGRFVPAWSHSLELTVLKPKAHQP